MGQPPFLLVPSLQLTGEPLPHAHHFGKPHAAPYLLIERLLVQQAQQLGIEVPEPAEEAALEVAEAGGVVSSSSSSSGSSGSSSSSGSGSAQRVRTPLPVSAIYAVGDNPAADVRGANAAGSPWVSVLVTKTGVATENSTADPAQVGREAVGRVCRGCAGQAGLQCFCMSMHAVRAVLCCAVLCCASPKFVFCVLFVWPQQLCLAYFMQVVVDDVEAAVEAGLHRVRHAKWHSMR